MAGDLLTRGARIIDGTGAPWFTGDVRILRFTETAPPLR